MLYRIFTEDMNREQIEALVYQEYEGFTMYSAQGFWKGIKENSLVIEVVSETRGAIDTVRKVAGAIKELNHQQAVLVETISNHSELV